MASANSTWEFKAEEGPSISGFVFGIRNVGKLGGVQLYFGKHLPNALPGTVFS